MQSFVFSSSSEIARFLFKKVSFTWDLEFLSFIDNIAVT